jgi:hypothetical protein
LQWLQDPSEINGDNLNNVGHEASRHFRNKKREYLKDNLNELVEVVVGKNTTPLKYNAQPLLSGQVLQRPSIAG